MELGQPLSATAAAGSGAGATLVTQSPASEVS